MGSDIIPFFAFLAILASGLNFGSDGKKQEDNDIVIKEPEVVIDVEKKPFRYSPLKHHEKLWDSAEIKPSQVFKIDNAIALYLDRKEIYDDIEKMRDGGVPSAIVFTLHGRESTWNLKKHLHEGSPLTGKTKWIPRGRPKSPPANGHTYTFNESAEDALYKLKSLETVNWSRCDDALYNIEKYNGFGYLKFRNINSPYLWSGTYHYSMGKYVADGKYSCTAVDKQLGTCAILLRMVDRNINVGFN